MAVVKKQHEIAKKADQPCSGIIYVHKREDCQSLATQISKATGFVCLPYHAGLKDSERSETQRKWTDGSCSVAVATVGKYSIPFLLLVSIYIHSPFLLLVSIYIYFMHSPHCRSFHHHH